MISKVYKISMAVFSVVFAAAVIACLGHLVFTSSLVNSSVTDRVYSAEKVGFYLKWLSIPFAIYVAALLFGAYFYTRYPQKVKDYVPPREFDTLRRLIPISLSQVEDPKNRKLIKRNIAIRLVFMLSSAILLLVCFGLSFIYLANSDFYVVDSNIISRNLNLFLSILPFALVIVVWGIATIYVIDITCRQDIEILRNEKLFKLKKHHHALLSPKAEKVTINVFRVGFGVLAITFIILGIFNKGVNDVFIKAINICTECIGLG